MFRRRKSIGLLDQLRKIMWPERGFRRLFSYLRQRVIRMPGTPACIAIGLACGVAISFTPFIGFHLLLGGLLAYVLRGNILASAIGTIVGNPWTLPFIIYADYKLGVVLLHSVGFDIVERSMNLAEFVGNPAELMVPVVIGGMVLGTLAWFTSFGIGYWALLGWREHRAKRLAAGRQRRKNRSQNDAP